MSDTEATYLQPKKSKLECEETLCISIPSKSVKTICVDEAKEKQLHLASIIKDCHESLRQVSREQGAELAWRKHLEDTDRLKEYSQAMYELASIWETNTTNPNLYARSRIKWITDYCIEYFFEKRIFMEKRQREMRLADTYVACDAVNPQTRADVTNLKDSYSSIKILDVGSCFNPFASEERFEVTALDLCPATENVLKGDFLKIKITPADSESSIVEGELLGLPSAHYDCVIFSLLLEYLPAPEDRLLCCRKAYELLRPEGILIIITPDSQHVGKNAKLMKNWRYALGTLGFFRICFEKLPHITCMAFRKLVEPQVARHWAEMHREDYMTISIGIPQDST